MKTAQTQRQIDAFLETKSNAKKKQIVQSLLDKGMIEEQNNIRQRVSDETIRMVRLQEDYQSKTSGLSVKQKAVVSLLEEVGVGSVKESAICAAYRGCTENAAKKRSHPFILSGKYIAVR